MNPTDVIQRDDIGIVAVDAFPPLDDAGVGVEPPAPLVAQLRVRNEELMVRHFGTPDSSAAKLVFRQHRVGATVVLAVGGDVDTLTAPQLTDAIVEAAREEPAAIIVDLTAVEFLGSAGMTALITSKRSILGTTRQVVVADGPVTSRPLKVMGLDAELELFASLDEAIAATA